MSRQQRQRDDQGQPAKGKEGRQAFEPLHGASRSSPFSAAFSRQEVGEGLRGDGFLVQEQRPRQPRQGLQLVDVLYLNGEVAPQRKDGPCRPRAQMSQTQRSAGIEVGPTSRQPEMNKCAPVQCPRGRKEQPEGPVQGIEKSRLTVGQEGSPGEEVGIPEGEPPRPQGPRGLRPVGVKVGEKIPARNHSPCRADVPEGQQEQQAQGQQGDPISQPRSRYSIRWNRQRRSVFRTVNASFHEIFFPSENSRPV